MISELLVLASLMSSPNSSFDVKNIIKIDESSQPSCFPRKQLIDEIKTNDAATPLFVGISSKIDDKALEIWVDNIHAGHRWIAFFTHSDGSSCIIFQGTEIGYADPNIKPPVSLQALQEEEQKQMEKHQEEELKNREKSQEYSHES